MNGKITLITPPDFYESSNLSILFCHLNEKQQEAVSSYLKASNIQSNINIYVYDKECDLEWLLYAYNLCDYKYLNLDQLDIITEIMAGYWLSKKNVYYNIADDVKAEIYKHINGNRVFDIEKFLERIVIESSI